MVMVGLGRLELPTSRLSSARSNQLSYKPEPEAARRSEKRPSGRAGPPAAAHGGAAAVTRTTGEREAKTALQSVRIVVPDKGTWF